MYVGRLRALADEMKCLAVVVHHIGKDVTKGERGHSSFRAALDASIAVEHDEKDTYRWLIPSKARDSGLMARMGFTLDVVGLGRNADGDERTSCIVEWHLDAEPAVVGKGKGEGLVVRVGGLTPAVLDLMTAIASNDRPTMDDLAQALGVSRQAVRKSLEPLQKKRLVLTRKKGTSVSYELSERGENALENAG
jgi:DNA-binding transcriptional ArsR family regulator